MTRALIPVPSGSEEIETMTVADVLVRGGVAVTMASVDAELPRGARGLPLATDRPFTAALHETWDLLYLPGGMPAATAFQAHSEVQAMLSQRLADQQLTAIICASPLALVPQQLYQHKTITSHPSVREDLTTAARGVTQPSFMTVP